MDYEPFRVAYTAGQPYVGATLSMYPAPNSHGGMGNFIAWDASEGKIVWSNPEPFSVWSGALATAGDVVFYGTLEGYLKAVDATSGKELYKFKTPSGIIGNVMTYEHAGKQYVGVLSGVGGWAGIGLAAGLTNPNEGLGAVGGYAALSDFTELGGQLTVFELPGDAPGAATTQAATSQPATTADIANAASAQAAGAAAATAADAATTPSPVMPAQGTADPSAPAEGMGAGKSTATGGVPMEPAADAAASGGAAAAPADPSAPAEGQGAGKSTATGGVPMEPAADAAAGGTAPASN